MAVREKLSLPYGGNSYQKQNIDCKEMEATRENKGINNDFKGTASKDKGVASEKQVTG